jgi:hypothetical protein
LALAQELAHPYGLGMARHFTAFLHERRREPVVVQVHANALLALTWFERFHLRNGVVVLDSLIGVTVHTSGLAWLH